MADWMLWTLAGFMVICTIAMVLALWNAEDGDDW